MIRLEVPLKGRPLRATGDVLLRAELVLRLKTIQGIWEDSPFLVDTGTEMTTMPACRAAELDLPIPRRPARGLTMRGQEVRVGLIRARIVGMDLTEYAFPCYFLGDPDHSPSTPVSNLLGLTGVVAQIHLGFDGTPLLGAVYGSLIVEKR
jgi:hypothetical protein